MTTSRRDFIETVAASSAVLALRGNEEGAAAKAAPRIVCVIRYQIDPYQRDAFKQYATRWARIIPRCGGHLIGYFLPHEGTNDVGWGLIAFDDLAAYAAYKARLSADADARENFAAVRSNRCILREERNFVEIVGETFGRPPAIETAG